MWLAANSALRRTASSACDGKSRLPGKGRMMGKVLLLPRVNFLLLWRFLWQLLCTAEGKLRQRNLLLMLLRSRHRR